MKSKFVLSTRKHWKMKQKFIMRFFCHPLYVHGCDHLSMNVIIFGLTCLYSDEHTLQLHFLHIPILISLLSLHFHLAPLLIYHLNTCDLAGMYADTWVETHFKFVCVLLCLCPCVCLITTMIVGWLHSVCRRVSLLNTDVMYVWYKCAAVPLFWNVCVLVFLCLCMCLIAPISIYCLCVCRVCQCVGTSVYVVTWMVACVCVLIDLRVDLSVLCCVCVRLLLWVWAGIVSMVYICLHAARCQSCVLWAIYFTRICVYSCLPLIFL